MTQEDIAHGFPDFRKAVESCRFYNCTHRHEPGCGVLAAIEAGSIHPERHALYQRLLAEHEKQATLLREQGAKQKCPFFVKAGYAAKRPPVRPDYRPLA